MEWVDGNIGSRLTMKYPSVYLMGDGAKGEVLSLAYAGAGQHQDAGAKMVHAAPNTTSRITNKSVSKHGGRTTYRGLVKVLPRAVNATSNVVCERAHLDDQSAPIQSHTSRSKKIVRRWRMRRPWVRSASSSYSTYAAEASASQKHYP
jgi:Fe-S cluster assembly scaffold protein SufB